MVGAAEARVPAQPLVLAALGAIFSFYFLPLRFPGFEGRAAPRAEAWVLTAAVCGAAAWAALSFLAAQRRSAGAEPRFCAEGRSRLIRSLALPGAAFFAGLVLGAAWTAVPGSAPRWGLDPGRIVGLEGTLAEDARVSFNARLMGVLELDAALGAAGERVSARGRATVFLPGRNLDPGASFSLRRGERLVLKGRVVEGRNGPLFSALSAARAPGAPGGFGVEAEKVRLGARGAALRKLWSRPWGALAGALLLGAKDALDSAENKRYVDSGCAHVLALSGMHLAVLASFAAFALKPLLGLRGAAAAGIVLMTLFAYLAGSQPSLVRAQAMYAVSFGALLLGLPRRGLALLAAAFLIQTSLDPESARTLSFQLSYLALAGLLVCGEPLDDLLRAWLPDFLRVPLAASVGAFLATAALCAASFGTLRPVGMLAGLLLAPAATAIMAGALLWLLIEPFWPYGAGILDAGLGFLVRANDAFAAFCARAPGLDAGVSLVSAASLAAGFLLVYGRRVRNNTRNRLDPIH